MVHKLKRVTWTQVGTSFNLDLLQISYLHMFYCRHTMCTLRSYIFSIFFWACSYNIYYLIKIISLYDSLWVFICVDNLLDGKNNVRGIDESFLKSPFECMVAHVGSQPRFYLWPHNVVVVFLCNLLCAANLLSI